MSEYTSGKRSSGCYEIEITNLKQQRDDLLVACKAMFLRIVMHYLIHQEICKLGKNCPDKKALKLGEQAIAKAAKQGT